MICTIRLKILLINIRKNR